MNFVESIAVPAIVAGLISLAANYVLRSYFHNRGVEDKDVDLAIDTAKELEEVCIQYWSQAESAATRDQGQRIAILAERLTVMISGLQDGRRWTYVDPKEIALRVRKAAMGLDFQVASRPERPEKVQEIGSEITTVIAALQRVRRS